MPTRRTPADWILFIVLSLGKLGPGPGVVGKGASSEPRVQATTKATRRSTTRGMGRPGRFARSTTNRQSTRKPRTGRLRERAVFDESTVRRPPGVGAAGIDAKHEVVAVTADFRAGNAAAMQILEVDAQRIRTERLENWVRSGLRKTTNDLGVSSALEEAAAAQAPSVPEPADWDPGAWTSEQKRPIPRHRP